MNGLIKIARGRLALFQISQLSIGFGLFFGQGMNDTGKMLVEQIWPNPFDAILPIHYYVIEKDGVVIVAVVVEKRQQQQP
jgi:hypothetical protein